MWRWHRLSDVCPFLSLPMTKHPFGSTSAPFTDGRCGRRSPERSAELAASGQESKRLRRHMVKSFCTMALSESSGSFQLVVSDEKKRSAGWFGSLAGDGSSSTGRGAPSQFYILCDPTESLWPAWMVVDGRGVQFGTDDLNGTAIPKECVLAITVDQEAERRRRSLQTAVLAVSTNPKSSSVRFQPGTSGWVPIRLHL
jgi:hypothetical protein